MVQSAHEVVHALLPFPLPRHTLIRPTRPFTDNDRTDGSNESNESNESDDIDDAISRLRATWREACRRCRCAVWLADAADLLPPLTSTHTGILPFRPRPPLAVGCYHPIPAHGGAHVYVSYTLVRRAILDGDLLLLDILTRSVYELATLLSFVRPHTGAFTATLALPVRASTTTATYVTPNRYTIMRVARVLRVSSAIATGTATGESACPSCRALMAVKRA